MPIGNKNKNTKKQTKDYMLIRTEQLSIPLSVTGHQLCSPSFFFFEVPRREIASIVMRATQQWCSWTRCHLTWPLEKNSCHIVSYKLSWLNKNFISYVPSLLLNRNRPLCPVLWPVSVFVDLFLLIRTRSSPAQITRIVSDINGCALTWKPSGCLLSCQCLLADYLINVQ